MRTGRALFLAALAAFGAGGPITVRPARAQNPAPLPVRVVVVTTFEAGRDTGDRPGEFQDWVEREHLTQPIEVRGMSHFVYTDNQGLFAICCGTREEAPLELMAFGLDRQFDLARAYWLVAAIGDGNPETASLGSVVWIQRVIDGDLAYEIDSRDAPADWPYGVIPLRPADADDRPAPTLEHPDGMVYALNPRLVALAYRASAAVLLEDKAHYRNYRTGYAGYPAALAAPSVLRGDSIGSVRYWHGRTLNHWADDWDGYWTHGHGIFVVSDPEDHLICGALAKLAALGRADFNRVMVLRAIAQYTVPPPQRKPSRKFEEEFPGDLIAYENAYRVGAPVVRELLAGWAAYGPAAP